MDGIFAAERPQVSKNGSRSEAIQSFFAVEYFPILRQIVLSERQIVGYNSTKRPLRLEERELIECDRNLVRYRLWIPLPLNCVAREAQSSCWTRWQSNHPSIHLNPCQESQETLPYAPQAMPVCPPCLLSSRLVDRSRWREGPRWNQLGQIVALSLLFLPIDRLPFLCSHGHATARFPHTQISVLFRELLLGIHFVVLLVYWLPWGLRPPTRYFSSLV